MPNLEIEPHGLYVRLFHGRKDPDQEMEDWGEDGPVLGPFSWYHTTYLTHVRFGDWPDGYDTLWEPTIHESLIYYDGMYYGDWSVMSGGQVLLCPGSAGAVEFFSPIKARLSEEDQDA